MLDNKFCILILLIILNEIKEFPANNITLETITGPKLSPTDVTLNSTDELIPVQNAITSTVKPKSCGEMNRKILDKQPYPNSLSKIKKCCPIGESLYTDNAANTRYCDTESYNFDVKVIKAALFDNCIEDLEEKIELEIEATNPCNASYVYGTELGDQIYVLHDGSLLVTDQYGNDSYEIFQDYCLDMNSENGNLTAVVCITSLDSHISRAQTIIFAIFMVISILCLMFVSFLHFAIKDLRTVHGLSLGVLSVCLACGYGFYIYAQIFEQNASKLGYVVQYCILSYYCWFSMLCFNICITVWYFLPRYKTITRFIRYGRLFIYGVFAFTVPIILVLITHHKKLSGMPSYFYQGWSESVQQTQRYFIPPVTTLILLGFAFLIGAYFGFRNLETISEIRGGVQYQAIIRNKLDEDSAIPTLDEEFLHETKKDARCTIILGCIIFLTWILEVITFYSPGEYLAFMDILNGLQGFFILMIYIFTRDRRNIIVRWWHDRGSHEVTPIILPMGKPIPPGSHVEMKEMNATNNNSSSA